MDGQLGSESVLKSMPSLEEASENLPRDKFDVQCELSSLKEKLEVKKLEVAEYSRQVTELASLLECTTAKQDALRIVEELERRFGDHGHLAQLNHQLSSAQEEAQLRLSQLHHVQEELEYYFLLSRQQARLLDESDRLQKKLLQLLLAQVRADKE